jgi:hypothetical protein
LQLLTPSAAAVSSRYIPANQVELGFAKIERDVIARGIFTSKRDLARKIRRYIDRYNHDAKPFRWTYADPTKRIAWTLYE